MRSRALAIGAATFLIFSFPPSVSGQELACPPVATLPGRGSIAGRVLDAQTDVTVGAVEVTLSSLTKNQVVSTRADGSGRFLFCTIPPGSYSLEAVFPGFGEASSLLDVPADTQLIKDLFLSFRDPNRRTGQLKGRVVMAGAGTPLPGAKVTLNVEDRPSTSDEEGFFEFSSVPAGSLEMVVSLFGYEDSHGGMVLGGGQTLDIEVRLSPQPFEMDPIVVTSTRLEMRGMLADVELRAERGWGTVLLEEDLALRRNLFRTTDILREYGADVIGNGKAVVFRRTGCGPTVYIDGIKVTYGNIRGEDPAVEAADALNMILPSHIHALEIYKGPAETPGEFLDSNSRCGVVLVWTRRGR